MDIEPFLKKLADLGSKERAEQDRRYHKSSRAHWGVPIPLSFACAKSYTKNFSQEELICFAKKLWTTNLFDPMICAAKLLGQKRIKASETLWDTLLHFLKDVDGWALEDQLAHAAWKCILANEALLDTLESWTTHPNFWMRRAALVYTLPFAKPGRKPHRMLRWAASYASDNQWFIQKAIGWWLRVLGEHNPSLVLQFLEDHGVALKSVARKEATRKLSSIR